MDGDGGLGVGRAGPNMLFLLLHFVFRAPSLLDILQPVVELTCTSEIIAAMAQLNDTSEVKTNLIRSFSLCVWKPL